MRPFLFRHAIIAPACQLLANLTGKPMNSHPAHVMLLAIALQESGAKHRWQIKGPARGFWQFEKGGGHAGIMRHRVTGPYAETLLEELNLPSAEHLAWDALPHSELLQAGWARLLLWSDPRPLPMPMPDNEEWAWDLYVENWRPGRPRREHWTANWQTALDVCGDF